MIRGISPVITFMVFFVLVGLYYLILTYLPSLKDREINKLKRSFMFAGVSIIVICLFFLGVSEVG
jgi:uncharacterized membrane protein